MTGKITLNYERLRLSNDELYNLQVILNESNVLDCFFDPKVLKELFGHGQLFPIVCYCEFRLQNNECPVESIISMFTSQAFKGQHEETAENRAIIKINGDSISGSEDFCHVLAEMTSAGGLANSHNQLRMGVITIH